MTKDHSIIVISSHVARGSVGNRAMVFALERLGFPVWAVPTVLLPHHPGQGPAEPIVPTDSAFGGLLETLIQDGRAGRIAGIVSGYLASAGQAEAVAALVESVKNARRDALYLCDPVIGDTGADRAGLYVAEAIAAAIRDRLLPLADAATPNAFECAWLAGYGDAAEPDLGALARGLPPPAMLVTSAPALMRGQAGNLLVSGDVTLLLEHPLVQTPIKGTGDLLTALLLARRLAGRDWPDAAQSALSSVLEVLAGSARAGADELMLPELQAALVAPRAPIGVRRLGEQAAAASKQESGWVAGVDGCRAGWIAVFIDLTETEPPRVRTFPRFAEILAAPEAPRRVAVDMPIGLPERIEGPGRAAEQAVRRFLGARQSSVFSIPARAAVMAEDYGESCRLALATSEPPRKVSRQGFMLFGKIRELDALMTPQLAERVIEVHPEVAFWRLNGEQHMSLPKKVKGRVNPAGMEERRALLESFGFPPEFLRQKPPAGAGEDDLLDACVAAIIAKRQVEGLVRPFPEPPEYDPRGLPIAIWA